MSGRRAKALRRRAVELGAYPENTRAFTTQLKKLWHTTPRPVRQKWARSES